MLIIDIVTLFPDLFEPHLNNLPFKKAADKELVKVNLHNLRDFAIDVRGTVDGKPYGGGIGMVLRPEPIYGALKHIYTQRYQTGQYSQEKYLQKTNYKNSKIVVLTPKGNMYTQKKADLYKNLKHLVLICGRYEGIDARVLDLDIAIKKEFDVNVDIEPISIGNFVLSGGEIPALVVSESIVRLIPGVLEKENAIKFESFSQYDQDDQNDQYCESCKKEHPQYTRPENFIGLKVPKILLSGNHKEIKEWRKEAVDLS